MTGVCENCNRPANNPQRMTCIYCGGHLHGRGQGTCLPCAAGAASTTETAATQRIKEAESAIRQLKDAAATARRRQSAATAPPNGRQGAAARAAQPPRPAPTAREQTTQSVDGNAESLTSPAPTAIGDAGPGPANGAAQAKRAARARSYSVDDGKPVSGNGAGETFSAARSRSSTRVRPMGWAVLEREPALWRRIVMFPVASRGRIIFLAILASIVLAVWGINTFIETHQPQDNPASPFVIERVAVEPPSAATGQEPARPTAATLPAELRARSKEAARQSLSAIGHALKAYAREREGLPPLLSSSLKELAPYGATPALLAAFEGDRFSSYKLQTSADGQRQTATLEATPKGLNESVSHTVSYFRSN